MNSTQIVEHCKYFIEIFYKELSTKQCFFFFLYFENAVVREKKYISDSDLINLQLTRVNKLKQYRVVHGTCDQEAKRL